MCVAPYTRLVPRLSDDRCVLICPDYLIRAYEADPYDAYVCFMIAQSFFGRAMNRQSDNRNYQIAQVSLAF